MAYGNIYWAGFQSKGVKGILYIDKLDYVGASSKLIMTKDGLNLEYRFTDWESPIIPLQCSFSILNTKGDFFELLPLMFSEERQYKVRVVLSTPIAYTAFDGYINCEPVTQRYLHNQVIDLVASNYLMKLDNIHPISIDTLQNKTFIDVINEILLSTGSTFPVRVNAKIHAEGDTPTTGQTLFNQNGFFTELFWEDNIERTTSLEILNRILKPFNCYIYWWQNYWYIERYEDLWNTSIDYVEYDANSLYTPSDSGAVVNKEFEITDLNENTFTQQSQELGGTPGVNTVKITLNDQRYLNLISFNFSNLELTSTAFPEPDFRTWKAWEPGYIWKTTTINDIVNAICRTRSGAESNTLQGLYHTFKTTILAKEDQLNITFKYNVDASNIGMGISTKLPFYIFTFHWYLRLLPNHDYIKQSDDVWNAYTDETEASWMQEVTIAGSDFDQDTHTATINVTIPLGQVKDYRISQDRGYLRGDQKFVLCIGEETIHPILEDGSADLSQTMYASVAYFGDAEVTSTGKNQDNVIEGTSNTKYLDKLDIDLDLYDAETFDYKNAILRGTDLDKRTERWGTTGGASEIIAKGVCWSGTNATPTLADEYSNDGTGYGVFESQLVNLTPNTFYYYRAYATDALGNTEYGDVKTFTSEQLKVGHKYHGGIIGYIFIPGQVGYVEGETHGIIVSIEDIDTHVVWGRLSGGGPYTCAAYGKEIGDGEANTAAIQANTFQNQFAIKKIITYEYEGYTDWFLPSLVELMAIHTNRVILGMATDWYWSSSEMDGAWKKAFAVDFKKDGGLIGDYWDKNNYMHTRACRNF